MGNQAPGRFMPAFSGRVWKPRRALVVNLLLGRLEVVELKQPTQPLSFGERTCFCIQPRIGKRDQIIEVLVVSFFLMMGHIFLEHVGQGALAKENQVVQALAFNRADPAFGVGIPIGAQRRQFEGFNARPFQDAVKARGVFAVAGVDQIAGVAQLARDSGDVAIDLFDPSFVRRVGQPAQHNLARLQMDEKEYVSGGQSRGRPDFNGKEIRGPEDLFVAADKLGPGGLAPPLRGNSQTMPVQNVANRLVRE